MLAILSGGHIFPDSCQRLQGDLLNLNTVERLGYYTCLIYTDQEFMSSLVGYCVY